MCPDLCTTKRKGITVSKIIPDSALDDRRNIQYAIQAEYGEWLFSSDFTYADGEWTIDGMDPFEWADAVLGKDED